MTISNCSSTVVVAPHPQPEILVCLLLEGIVLLHTSFLRYDSYPGALLLRIASTPTLSLPSIDTGQRLGMMHQYADPTWLMLNVSFAVSM